MNTVESIINSELERLLIKDGEEKYEIYKKYFKSPSSIKNLDTYRKLCTKYNFSLKHYNSMIVTKKIFYAVLLLLVGSIIYAFTKT